MATNAKTDSASQESATGDRTGAAGQNRSETDVEQLKAEFASLKSDVSDLTATLRQYTSDKAAEGRSQVRETADRSREQAAEGLGAVEAEIEKRPLTSVVAGFGIGLILSRLLERR
jgi:ElaB/YqjD/DUF883 family membrane-anchored ribosome-binding protein